MLVQKSVFGKKPRFRRGKPLFCKTTLCKNTKKSSINRKKHKVKIRNNKVFRLKFAHSICIGVLLFVYTLFTNLLNVRFLQNNDFRLGSPFEVQCVTLKCFK